MTILNGIELPANKNRDTNDLRTTLLGNLTCDFAKKEGMKLFFLWNKIARDRHSAEIKGVYFVEVLNTVRKCLDKWGKCCVLDLHRFYRPPPVGDYPIFFGTNNRQTVSGDFDKLAAGILEKAMRCELQIDRSVYLPGTERKEGEKFGATKPLILTNWLKREEPRVEAIQIEFYKDLLENKRVIRSVLPRALAQILITAVK
jgi:hypothetical protein